MIEVVHDDDHLLAVAKPAGMLAVAQRGSPDEPESAHGQASRLAGARLFVVHRLDRETSGLLVFAKDAETHRHLSLAFETRQVEKVYLAAVLGTLDAQAGEVDEPIRAFGSGRMGVHPRGKPAQTRWVVLERLPDADLLEVRPVTGRRHQLRVHLYAIGHPVLGDTRYGRPRPVGGAPRLMLHARELSFTDPGGRPISVRREPPGDFAEVLDGFRL